MGPLQRFCYTAARAVQRLREVRTAPPDVRPILGSTMLSLPRLLNLQRLAGQLIDEGVPGDFIECGTWRGGSGALLARAGAAAMPPRKTWFCDSYQGLPRPSRIDGWYAQLWTGHVQASPADVEACLASLGVSLEQVEIVAGWFDEVLPGLATGQLALLHIDCDWYDSVTTCLDHLYDRVAVGGFVVIDDYGYWPGCRRAVEDFLARRGIDAELVVVDATGRYFRKTDAGACR